MKRFPNLPHQQWFTQKLVDEFNSDEARWRQSIFRRLKRKLNSTIAEDLRSMLERLHAIEGRTHDRR